MLKRKRVEKSVPEKPHIIERGYFMILAILLAVPVAFFALVYIAFDSPDFVNPVTRIEYILEVDFQDEQILKANYQRTQIDRETFDISLIMTQSEFESFILQRCGSLDVISEYGDSLQYTHEIYSMHHCGSELASFLWDLSAKIDASDIDSYRIDIHGELMEECNSNSMFNLEYPAGFCTVSCYCNR